RNSELELLLANALADINTLRKLLHATPITKIQDAVLPTPTTAPLRQSYGRKLNLALGVSLESLPEVILDRIVSFVDPDSIFRLCHAVPYYKYISKAMYDIASEDALEVNSLWPTFEFPMNLRSFRKNPLHFLNYTRILKRHGLSISLGVQDLEYLNEVGPYLTPTVSVSCYTKSLLHVFTLLKSSGVKCVDFLHLMGAPRDATTTDWGILTKLQINVIDFEMGDSALFMSGLKNIFGLNALHIDRASGTDFETLFDCSSLRSIQFNHLSLESLPSIMQGIKKSITLEWVEFIGNNIPTRNAMREGIIRSNCGWELLTCLNDLNKPNGWALKRKVCSNE
ncbi:hypothetical protein BCR33DRAFT_711243, partial [Rhizoclosmatium globosum]